MGDGELRLDPAKIKALLEWPRPNNVTEVWSFIGATHYLRKFIAYFSKSTAPLHAGTSGNKPFSQGKKQETFFEEWNRKISRVPVLALPNLQLVFQIQTDASGNAFGVVLMQGGRPACYHSKLFSGALLNYPTYDEELYTLVQTGKKWKHYMLRKETVIYTDHQTLQHLPTHSKTKQFRHFKRMVFLN